MVRMESEFQVFASSEFGDVDDLTDMESKMFDDNGKDFKDGSFAILNSRLFEEARRVKETEGSVRFPQRIIQPPEQLILRDLLALGEFLRFVPGVLSPADACKDKLVQVPGKMQQKIADTVAGLVLTPPDIFIREFLDTSFNARPIVVHETESAPLDIWPTQVVTHRSGLPSSSAS